jgi:hypothetical protein
MRRKTSHLTARRFLLAQQPVYRERQYGKPIVIL